MTMRKRESQMKTAEQILEAYNDQNQDLEGFVTLSAMIDAELKVVAKEQRHACAEAVIAMGSVGDTESLVNKASAHSACMNSHLQF